MRNRLAPVVFSFAAFVVLLTVVYLVSSFGGGGGGDRSVDIGLLTADCDEVAAQELYVQRAFQCEDGTRVVMFADDRARDAYLDVAEHFGTVTVERGSSWARIR